MKGKDIWLECSAWQSLRRFARIGTAVVADSTRNIRHHAFQAIASMVYSAGVQNRVSRRISRSLLYSVGDKKSGWIEQHSGLRSVKQWEVGIGRSR